MKPPGVSFCQLPELGDVIKQDLLTDSHSANHRAVCPTIAKSSNPIGNSIKMSALPYSAPHKTGTRLPTPSLCYRRSKLRAMVGSNRCRIDRAG